MARLEGLPKPVTVAELKRPEGEPTQTHLIEEAFLSNDVVKADLGRAIAQTLDRLVDE